MRKAYEFALNHIGQDKESTDIWKDYIQFLKAGEVRLVTIFETSVPSTASDLGCNDMG